MKEWRAAILFICMIMMLAALFFSRALLSVGMILFVTISFFYQSPARQLKNFFSEPILWSMSLLFFLPLISGLWSEDRSAWMASLQLKLPLVALPLAFAARFQFSEVQRDLVLLFFIFLVFTGTAWSMYQYAGDMRSINESYLRAKSISTPLENDHIRFSWMVNAAIIASGWYWLKGKIAPRLFYWLLPVMAGWFIIFLHILAARTGLIAFYLGVLILLGWVITRKKEKKYWIGLLLLPVFPLAAYFIFPTFQNRVKYFLYEKEYFHPQGYLEGSNDAVRIISLKAGWEIMNQHPFYGTGSGDLQIKTREWYGKNYPQMIDSDKIYPSSEWMMHGASYGWPGFIIFSVIIIIPFFSRVRYRLPWWILLATLSFSLLFDIGLSVQFGIFLFAISILFSWKCVKQEIM